MTIGEGRILLAEDDENDIELTLAALDEHKLANFVDVARDGVEALDYLFRRGAHAGRKSPSPVLVLLDLKMPRVDGLDVLRQVRRDPLLRTMPVVVLTSSREAPDISNCYELGVNAYVVKPVKFEDFVKAVSQLGSFWILINQPPLSAT
jgi:CheY-like chemotaxis protein